MTNNNVIKNFNTQATCFRHPIWIVQIIFRSVSIAKFLDI